MRLPNWLYVRLDRLVRAERTRRQDEDRAELERQDKATRDFYDRLRKEHKIHEALGRKAADCPYYPCVPKVSDW